MQSKHTNEQIELRHIIDRYEGLVLDLFGVIHDGIAPFPEALKVLRRLRMCHKRICLLSNSPRRAIQVAVRLKAMDIGPELYDGLITSGELVFSALTGAKKTALPVPGSRFLHIGPDELSGLLAGADFTSVDDARAAHFILATGSIMAKAKRTLLADLQKRDLPLICANPDITVLVGNQMVSCAGAVAEQYQSIGGRVFRFGKPCLPAYEEAARILRLPASRILAIGDSLATDIAGGNGAGIDAALVMTGVHRGDFRWDVRPDKQGFRQLCRKHRARPNFVLPALAWASVPIADLG